MTTIDILGNSIFYREFGDPDNPPIILLHGLYGDSSTVAPLARALATRLRVIAPDAIGHGNSSRPVDFTLEDQGRMVDALIAALGYDNAAVLGISMGSYLAAQAAIDEPSRISKLILVVPKAHGITSSSVAYAQRLGFDLANATTDEMLAFMAGALWSPDTPQQKRDEILAGQPEDPIVLTADERSAVERSLAGFDLRPRLSSITAPTLVISGLSDGLNPPEAGREVAQHIPGSRFTVYEHSGHMLASEEEGRLVAEVLAFLFD